MQYTNPNKKARFKKKDQAPPEKARCHHKTPRNSLQKTLKSKANETSKPPNTESSTSPFPSQSQTACQLHQSVPAYVKHSS